MEYSDAMQESRWSAFWSGLPTFRPRTLTSAKEKWSPEELGDLHDQYFPSIYRYVFFRLQDEELCADISSEVFVRLLDAVGPKKTKIKNVRAWLFGTASNLIQDHLRQKYRRRTEALEEDDDLTGDLSPEHDLEKSIDHEDLHRALAHLTADQQMVLSLRFSQELSIDETSQIMGKSESAVKVLQFRALAALRKILEEKPV